MSFSYSITSEPGAAFGRCVSVLTSLLGSKDVGGVSETSLIYSLILFGRSDGDN